ncbi:MAG: glutamate 5-kinase [Phascolarctobacterium sp.]|nr:glutamate 5-kinase [Phascolarctobacterium sp.]
MRGLVNMTSERKNLKTAKRIVVKVGTSTITHKNGKMNFSQIDRLAREISDLQNQGREMILVTSGAVAVGVDRLGLKEKPGTIPGKQAAAAVGQGVLMHTYEKFFAEYGQIVAQVLLTKTESLDRHRYTNSRNTFMELVKQRVIPIVNENDVVALDELKIGDNDNMSALVAGIIDVDLVIILSDVDGLYTANPRTDPNAKLMHEVYEITPDIEAFAGGAGSQCGTGGMTTKLQAAKAATSSGINLVIASGTENGAIPNILNGEEIGTLFVSRENRLQFRKRWLAFGARIKGSIIIDAGCVRALHKAGGCSILPAGIADVNGDFETGSTVSVKDGSGHELARGLVHYSSDELEKIKGCKSADIEKLLGHKNYDEVIHRDDLVIL